MRKGILRQYSCIVALALMFSLGSVGIVGATTQTKSNHYMVTETQIGAGSALKECSTSYCGKISVGDTTVGRASSANYSAQFGFNTSDVPLLEVMAIGGTQDMGVLDDTTTGTAVSTIKVRNYLSDGYVLQITGTPPSQGVHHLNALTTPTTSHQGAEQFGINLANNSAPNIGADPVQVPSGTFSFGTTGCDDMVTTCDYGTPDLFKYVDGDVVAHSAKSSGETDYTMSMIINVSNVTPGGHYSGTFSAVAVPVF